MTRDQKLMIIFRHTHKDFKGGRGDTRRIMIYRVNVGSVSVPLAALADDEIERELPYALHCEQKRIAAREKQKQRR